MKRSTKDFLSSLEKRTSIIIDWSNLEPTDKYVQQNNQPVEVDTLFFNEGKFIVMVYSCGCNTCKEVMAMQIFYGLGNSKLIDAEHVRNEIKKVAPSVKLEVLNMFDLKSIAK